MPLFVAIAMVLMSSVLICYTKDVVSLKFLYSVCIRLSSVCIFVMSRVWFLALFCTPFVFACILLYSVCTPFVLRLYPVCAARDVSSLGLLCSVCTPLYSCVLRLYSFVPLGMSFPRSVCTPFLRVCTLTPFCEYNSIRKREE